jgi:hypothetical protein
MDPDVSTWTGTAPAVDPARILRVHRYPDPDEVRPQIREAAHRAAGEVESLARPVAAYRRVVISACRDGTLTLAGGTSFYCPAFDRLLKGCTEVVAFVLTLGPKVDARVMELMEEFEPLDALFVEAAGWLAIEAATRDLGAHLRAELSRERLAVSHRMGPGYSYRQDPRGAQDRVGWPLEQQAELFGLFGGDEIPVELLTSAAMKPKMSRSGLFGVAPAAA